MNTEELLKQLEVAFGIKKAKKLVKKIKSIKDNNPNIAYNFIFSEDGESVVAIKKTNERE